MSHALDLIITGRGVSGDEALRIGLVNRLCEPVFALPTALKLAHAIAVLPQRCLRHDRLSAYEQWHLPVDAAIARSYGCFGGGFGL